MRHRHLQRTIIFGTIVLISLLIVQVYWFQKAFDISEKQFDHSVQIALKRVTDSITGSDLGKVEVKKLSSNFYFVNSNAELDPHELDSLLHSEFLLHDLHIDYELGVYDAFKDTLVYGNYIQSTKTRLIEKEVAKGQFAQTPVQNFAVYFPNKVSYLASEMYIWIFSTIALILMMGFFAYAIYSLLKEKRYMDVKNDFINNLTHEFKTPVTNIKIAADVLKNKYGHSNEDILYFEILQKENEKLQHKIEHILSAAANEKPTLKTPEKIDVHEVLRDCAKSFHLKIEQRNGVLTLDLDPDQPTIYGNQELLFQAFNNLIDNSEKYSPENPQIQIKSRKTEKGLVLTFMDKGVGIPFGDQKKVFDKFYRQEKGNIHNVKGFGLGLNFVKNVIRVHKGKIQLRSELNKGTEIDILLPTV